jgi:hypothetical protein
MTKDEALDLALEALESMAHGQDLYELEEKAITAIKQARSAPVREPKETDFSRALRLYDEAVERLSPAAQRQWVWLTDEDIEQEFGFIDELLRDCVHRTEAKVREKNNE